MSKRVKKSSTTKIIKRPVKRAQLQKRSRKLSVAGAQISHLQTRSRKLSVAVSQFSCSWDLEANLAQAAEMVREAARNGAQVILLQELFETPYFCIEQDVRHLKLAAELAHSRPVQQMMKLARQLNVVLPVSFFERSGQAYFNSLAMIDAGGEVLGVYRKAHIPNGVGYQEKTYFSPGDTGFKVWSTRYGRLGAGICWDQWFPECARAMALQGAELLLYPTAIGSEPPPALPVDSRRHWQRTQQGHAAANVMPLLAANRYGLERSLQKPKELYIQFYGSSFIADASGALLSEAPQDQDALLYAEFDLAQLAELRDNWFVFRDRRPELYGSLSSLDGR